MLRLTNRVQPYAWGTTDAIADLLGEEPDGTPRAELWIGAHPSAPSRVPGGTGLDEVVAADPAAALGAGGGDRLGFLLKVLSAAAPLSLQAHPDAATAARRHAEEEAAGVPADAPHRLYKDTAHKPELLYALEPFAAMAGFRAPAAARALLAGLDLPALAPGPRDLLAALLADLAADPDDPGADAAALAGATRRLLSAPADAAGPLVAAVATACAEDPRLADDPSARCVVDLAAHHPGDAGVLVSTLLNQVRLAAGEALYLPAGNVHAYLSGTGVELMASSDNVLRGGLTPKHVDVDELLAVLDFRVLPAPLLPARVEVADGTRAAVFTPPDVDDFALTVLDLAGAPWTAPAPAPRSVLCLDGEVVLRTAGGGPGERELVLVRGGTAFVGAGEGPLVVSGTGRVALASPALR